MICGISLPSSMTNTMRLRKLCRPANAAGLSADQVSRSARHSSRIAGSRETFTDVTVFSNQSAFSARRNHLESSGDVFVESCVPVFAVILTRVPANVDNAHQV